jgi:hypothetical protein
VARGVHVPARITHPVTVREFDNLADYQAGVGGPIEAIDIRLLDIKMYVNEEGLLRGLDLNSRATFLWWYHVPESRQRAFLVGDAVILGWPDQDGESTDLPDALLALFSKPGFYWLEVQREEGEEWVALADLPQFEDYFDAVVWALIYNDRMRPHQLKVVGGAGPIDGVAPS